MAITDKDFIGSGLVFPLNIDSKGGVRPETGKALIESSLRTITSTPNGTRFFLGEFRTRLWELIEEPNDSVVFSLMEGFIKEAFNDWEKRIDTFSVEYYTPSETKIIILVKYEIKSTKEQGTFIFPFYNKIIY